jgi:hypothetical protein
MKPHTQKVTKKPLMAEGSTISSCDVLHSPLREKFGCTQPAMDTEYDVNHEQSDKPQFHKP